MNKPFVKELIITNYVLLGSFAMIIIVGNLLYGGTKRQDRHVRSNRSW